MSNGLRIWVLGIRLILLSCGLGVLAGCQHQAAVHRQIDYTAPLPAGELALRKIAREQYPDFSAAFAAANREELRKSIGNSLAYLSRASSERVYPYLDISHERAVATLQGFLALLDQQPAVAPQQINAEIANLFEVYQSVGAPDPEGNGYTGQVLFTGYFTPTYEASLSRGGRYQWPIYKRPGDLVTDESGELGGRKMPDGTMAPYLSRREIESGALAGQELAWLTSRWNAYVVTIQGSARLRLPDGRIYEVGFAGSNGRAYVSPGQQMITDGLISRQELSFRTLNNYFDSHPDAMDKYLWLNERTVFFTERPGGPFGALNVPVTPFASIATDKKVYPPALLAFLSVPIPATEGSFPGSTASVTDSQRPFAGFLLDQDRGGAIRSAGRCDIYMGIGEHAQEMSGHQLNPGKLYYLAIRPEWIGRYLHPPVR